MKMKKISICLLSGLLLLSSCLDEDPKYTTNEEIVYSSEQSAQMALNGLYGLMAVQGSFAQLLPEINTEASGLCWTSYNTSDNRQQYVSGQIPVDNEFNNLVWGAVYQAIANCNIFIEACESDRSANFDRKANMVAQAKFLRGALYYQLYTFYGGVPLRLEPTDKDNTDVPRASRQAILDQIIQDWTDAARDLDDEMSSESGAPTAPCKASAWAYLAKLYWLMGCNAWAADSYVDPAGKAYGADAWAQGELKQSWPEMKSSQEYFLKAKAYGDSVFQHNPFQLEPDFNTLFNGQRVQLSKEFIFVIDATMNTTENVGYNSLHWTFSPQNCSPGETWGRAQPSHAFYNWAAGTYQNDPRLDATFVTKWVKYVNQAPSAEIMASYPIVRKLVQDTTWVDSVVRPGRPPIQVPVVTTEYQFVDSIDFSDTQKYADVTNPQPEELDSIVYEQYCKTKSPDAWNIDDWPYFGKYMTMNCSGRYADNNLYVYRYADFLLLMADVENELGNLGTAQGYVNQVLDRARNSSGGDGVYPLAVNATSKEEMREYIFNERLFELVAEFDGFVDTRRRGINWRRAILERNNNDGITRRCYIYGKLNGYQSPWREFWYPYDMAVSGDKEAIESATVAEASDAQWNEYLIKNQLIPLPRMEFSSNKALTSADQNPGY